MKWVNLVGCTQDKEIHVVFFVCFENHVERCTHRYRWQDNIKVETR